MTTDVVDPNFATMEDGRRLLVLPASIGAVFLGAGILQLARPWPAVGDSAVAELVVRHFARHFPLSGPYSAQRGYNHPLPWVYVLEWLPYRLSGGWSSAAPAAALWWNGAWAAAMVWTLARRAAVGLGLVALAGLFIMAGRVEGVVLLLPWNPNLAVVPALALLFVSWRVAVGDGSLLPLSVGLAIWCAGAHLGFLPFAIAIASSSAAVLAIRASRAGAAELRRLLRPALLAVAVGTVLAAPMLVDLIAHGAQSNPARIVDGLAPTDTRTRVPATQAIKVLRAELAIPPAWTRTKPPYDLLLYRPPARAPIVLVLAVVVVIAAWRRRARDELVGIAISLVALAAATVGLMYIDNSTLAPWYLLPAHVAGVGLAAFLVWSGGRSVAQFARVPRRRVIALPIACALVTAFAVSLWRTPPFQKTVSSTTAHLAGLIETRFPKGSRFVVDGPVQYDGFYSQSLTLQLDKAGYSVRVPDEDLFMYTRALAVPDGWNATRLMLEISGPAPTQPERDAALIGSVVVPQDVVFAGRTLSVWERARQRRQRSPARAARVPAPAR